jgi:SRSO17 transposase
VLVEVEEWAGQFERLCERIGLDHYQVRRWDAWYRHASLVLVAQGFLAAVRAQATASRRVGAGGG